MSSAHRWAVVFAIALAGTARAELPAQWESGGFHHDGYEVTTDSKEAFEGKPSIRIQSSPAIAPQGEANAATGFFAERYRGKRVRFSAFLKTREVNRWSGLWLSLDGPAERPGQKGVRLRFDNMRNRPVKGNTSWARYEVVVDVPPESSDVTIGFFLVGSGTVWMAKPSFEVVGNDVPVTSSTAKNLPAEPQLDLNQQ
jgi:hypothetical protein